VRTRVLLLAAMVICVLLSASRSAEPLTRSTWRIEKALQDACPGLSKGRMKLWAPVIRKMAIKHGFCPYTEVSIIRYESRCNERLIHDNLPNEYSVGLGQINVIWHRDCKNGKLKSPRCKVYIGMLMDGASNLRVTASMITANRKMCRDRTGQPALFARWLSSYGGYNNSRGRKGVWCNMRKDRKGLWRDVKVPTHTRNVMNYRRYLVRRWR